MRVFLIALTEPHAGTWGKLKQRWPDRHHIVTETLAMVSPVGGITTSGQIGKSIGISSSEDDATGIVLPLTGHSGSFPSDAVDWMNAAFNE